MNLNEKQTHRGFALIEFQDRYDSKCSIQKSSLAFEEAIWFGVDDANPQIMASKTKKGGTGWVPYPIPEDVSLTTRMHLTRDQVKELLPILEHFVVTGEVANPENQGINELLDGMVDTLEMAKNTLIRFEIDLDIANHALLGKICTFIEFVRNRNITKTAPTFVRALDLLKAVKKVLEDLDPKVTDDNLFTDVHYYIEASEDYLEKSGS